MALTGRIPGFSTGETGRNVAVAIAYLILLPIWIFLLPFIAAIFVARNSYGWAEVLSRLPGISSKGGATAGVAAFAYVFVLFAVVGAATGGGGSAPDGTTSADRSATASSTVTNTPSPTSTPSPSEDLRATVQTGLSEGGFSDGVRDIQITDADAGYVVIVRYDLSSLGNAEDDEFDSNHMAIEVMSRVYQSGYEIQDVAVFGYVTVQDQYGNQEDAVVSKVQINAETADRINWENILPDNIPDAADDYVFRYDYY